MFEYDPDSGTRAVKATCKFCQKYYPKISSQYRGKLVKDVETYGKTGTTYLLKPNLKRHMDSQGHLKCVELETGQPTCKKQRSISSAFGGAKAMAKLSLKPLFHASLYLGRSEKPFNQFPSLLDTCSDMGLTLTSSYNNREAAKAFNHIIVDQIKNDLHKHVKECNFFSFMVDGSSVAKRKLTYEAELFYVRTAKDLSPHTELLSFVPMKSYASVSSQNLSHALTKELLVVGIQASEHQT